MGTKTEDLIQILDELILLLRSDKETHWSDWMSRVKARLSASDFSGIELLLNAYGGMGSFNDLIIFQKIENGKFIWTDESKEKNDKLDLLRSKAWELATWLKRSDKTR